MYHDNFFRVLIALLFTFGGLIALAVLGLFFAMLFTAHGSVAIALLSAAAVVGSGLYLVVYKALK